MSGTSIFLVHGRDSGAKDTVARFLEKSTGREVLALSEQANRGLTIIEKFEEHAGKGCFAVVLVTPDDMGCLRADLDAAQQSDQKLALLKARARQNVVYELGYFHAKLGRRHVCALLKGAVDLPSDYSGVIYLPLDDHDGWRLKLADELRAAGIPVQL
jgi:predicted nucleotide-binding protein